MLFEESSLLGASKISVDVRVLEASSDLWAALAIDLFVHGVGREMGDLPASWHG